MAVKIYSDVTKKFYDDEAAALKAEDEVKKVQDERITRRKEMAELVNAKRIACDNTRKAYEKARQEYHSVLDKFCKEYGTYHYTMTNKDVEDFFDSCWPQLW